MSRFVERITKAVVDQVIQQSYDNGEPTALIINKCNALFDNEEEFRSFWNDLGERVRNEYKENWRE
jgi:hypothetical protein